MLLRRPPSSLRHHSIALYFACSKELRDSLVALFMRESPVFISDQASLVDFHILAAARHSRVSKSEKST